MENKLFEIKAAIVTAAGVFTSLFGWVGWLLLLFLGCMAADFATGVGVACKNGKWSSSVARAGLWHKGGMIAATTAAGALDLVVWLLTVCVPSIELPFDYSVLFLPLAMCWYIVTELGSIVENAAALGAPIPKFLQKALAVLSAHLDGDGENSEDS